MISRSEITHVIAERTMHVTDLPALNKAIAGYLLEQNRVDELDSLMRDVIAYRAAHGHVEATVISAYTLTESVRAEMLGAMKQEYPRAKSYILNEKIDESVVGGLRIEFAGEELDLTVKAKLNTFKRLTLSRKD